MFGRVVFVIWYSGVPIEMSWRLPIYYTLSDASYAVIPDPTLEDLTMGTPSAKILTKAEASQKRKSSTSGSTSSHVAKRTRNRGRRYATPTTEGPGTRGSQGKGIMVDDAAAPLDFFSFSGGPCYAAYPKGGVAGNFEFTREEWDALYRPTFGVLTKEVFKDLVVCKTVVDQFPSPGEMVRVEALSEDQLTAKMSVLHCMMMSHGGELLARYRGLLQSHNELQRQVAGLNDKLSSSDAAFGKSKAKGKEIKKKIKSLTKSLDQLNAEVARLSTALNQAIVLEAEKDEEILRLKATPPEFASFFCSKFQDLVWKLSMHQTKDDFAGVLKKMAHFMPGAQGRLAEASPLVAQTDYAFLNKIVSMPLNLYLLFSNLSLKNWLIPTSRDARVSPPIAKESTMTHAFESLKLPVNVVPTSSVVALEQNEDAFVQGTSHVLDDVAEVTAVGSKRVSSGPTDVVSLSVGEKGDGSLLSSTTDEEAVVNPSRV
ncbi:hypothetical protein Tco_1164453 [Tanacetum coccineum]